MVRVATALLLGLLAPAATGVVAAEPARLPATRAEARIEGRSVPDIPLQLANGDERMLSELGQGQALLVTFFYGRCAGVCQPFLEWD
jgi:cytochrome oxidase Cu insertion factor (SCO1/SenC/PrrC family)